MTEKKTQENTINCALNAGCIFIDSHKGDVHCIGLQFANGFRNLFFRNFAFFEWNFSFKKGHIALQIRPAQHLLHFIRASGDFRFELDQEILCWCKNAWTFLRRCDRCMTNKMEIWWKRTQKYQMFYLKNEMVCKTFVDKTLESVHIIMLFSHRRK